MPDVPFDDAVSKGIEVIQHGGLVWQKFTCSHCGSRQTMETPNTFFTHGTCEECGRDTCIRKQGCGLAISLYMPARFRTQEIKNGHPTTD